MAAPSFVGAGSGVVWQSGAGLAVTKAGCTVGNLVILQIGVDGNDTATLSSISGVEALDGTDNTWTTGPNSVAVTQLSAYWYLGRATGTTVSTAVASSSGPDTYSRIYEFSGVATGTTLATVIENGAGTAAAGGPTNAASITDVGVTTNDTDRLAINLVWVNDDNAVGSFTGETGGNWTEAVAEYAVTTGTDMCLQLQTAGMASAGTINGGSYSMGVADYWYVIGFALIPAPPLPIPTVVIPQGIGATA